VNVELQVVSEAPGVATTPGPQISGPFLNVPDAGSNHRPVIVSLIATWICATPTLSPADPEITTVPAGTTASSAGAVIVACGGSWSPGDAPTENATVGVVFETMLETSTERTEAV
jgi:hypothetical protein